MINTLPYGDEPTSSSQFLFKMLQEARYLRSWLSFCSSRLQVIKKIIFFHFRMGKLNFVGVLSYFFGRLVEVGKLEPPQENGFYQAGQVKNIFPKL